MRLSREEALQVVKETYSLWDHIRDQGPLSWERWCRRTTDPQAKADLAALVLLPDGTPRRRAGFIRRWRIKRCIRRHPELNRIVQFELEYQQRHFARAVWSRHHIVAPELKSAEWKGLYDQIQALLEKYGRNDAFGRGDFFLIDYEVEECAHKIEFRKIDVLTPSLVEEIQRLLIGWRNPWAVVIQVCLDGEPSPLDGYTSGIDVWRDRIEEYWDVDSLRRHLGQRFKW